MARTEPVSDWTSDFDVLDESYVLNPFPRWDELRRVCPIARTDRRGRAWLPTTYEDVAAVAKDVDHFSSANTSVIDAMDEPETPILTYGLPRSHPILPCTRGPAVCCFRGSRTPGWNRTSR